MEDERSISNNLRVASFSCYLNNAEESIVPKLAGSMQDLLSPPETTYPVSSGRTNAKEGEDSIFSADKYFNMKMEYDKRTKCGNKKEGSADLHHLKPNFNLETRSIFSETISLNSQITLLSNNSKLQRSPPQTKEKRSIGKRFFASFGCNGSCLDKKDVYFSFENRVLNGTKQSQAGLKRGENLQFEFQVQDPGIKNLTVKSHFKEEEKEEVEPRTSLDVFGSDRMKKGDIASNLERKLSMLTWDAIPREQNLPKTNFGSSTLCDDMASDASSDLFEIENISCTGQLMTRGSLGLVNNFLLTRQASDNMSSCMSPTTWYAPSETSIEWSVVTASAADFSIASDYENVKN